MFAETLLREKRRAAGFVVEKDGFDHRLHIPGNAGAVVVKFFHHPVNVATTWRAGDEPLNELPTDKRTGVRVLGNLLVGGLEFHRREGDVGRAAVLRCGVAGVRIHGDATNRGQTWQDHVV